MVAEEDEEEVDVNFGPFLREETPLEASSSLSSENDGLGDNADKIPWSSVDFQDASAASQPIDNTRGYGRKDETLMQMGLTEVYGKNLMIEKSIELGLISPIQHDGSVVCREGGNLVFGNGSAAVNDLREEDLQWQTVGSLNPMTSGKLIKRKHGEDAISRRTRAQHSLANYTLEELETFLQESDDDDLQSLDDEEEYRKFLAAVLPEGAVDEQPEQEDENIDENEESDADFMIEIEEALESDADESLNNNEGRNGKREGVGHRLKTRQKKCLKERVKNRHHLHGHAKMPLHGLRPILPHMLNADVAFPPTLGYQSCPQSFSHCSSSFYGTGLIYGFTAHQIGQLHSLVYEHAQLLIQAFSVCVLDISRQQVASQVQNMIYEIGEKREEALSFRKVPYPVVCFQPQNLHSPLHIDIHQTTKCCFWTPLIDKPVVSVLDVAPLELAKGYMIDISATVSSYRRNDLENAGDEIYLEREPLFPLHRVSLSRESVNDIQGGTAATLLNTVRQLSPGQMLPKKSMAATLVESTKKDSGALVPKEIAKLAQRFYPLFNSALFPHMPPVPSIANRVLFTDAEDGLLALGLMEYNNDWMAIQRRFLPCKFKHQIFVRQKNRSSSRAPENPIKAVRRMKASPLTADEMACIKKGLKLFKQDWWSIWKSFVPHRDPSMIQRQWRVATGTQKSYKKSEDYKKRRRIYEATRKKLKASTTDCQTSSEKEVGNGEEMADDWDDEDEAYVHEAFLADGEPRASKHMLHDIPLTSFSRSNMQSTHMIPYRVTHINDKRASVIDERGESEQKGGAIHEVGTCSKPLGDTHPLSHISHVQCSASFTACFGNVSSNSISRPSICKNEGARIVKLAPDLPPVNLPPSVRVISQSSFKSYNGEPSYSKTGLSAVANHLHWLPQVPKDKIAIAKPGGDINNLPENIPEINTLGNENILADQYVAEENTSQSDVHMHPSLFKASERFSSYYPKNYTASVPNSEAASLDLETINFHPLLRRVDNISGEYSVAGEAEALQGNCDNFLQPADGTFRKVVDDSQFETETVMEEEELSDSDEEIQHVKFDCEEMEDSEGEGLDS